MASAGLAAVGAAIPGAGVILGPLFGAIGAIIDQNLILPAIVKPPGDRTPQDLKLSLASEGAALHYAWGANVRVPAHVIWVSKPWYVSQSGSDKRQGAAPGTYYAHVALAVLGNDDEVSPMHCGQILANGKRIYLRTLTAATIQTTSRSHTELVFPGVVIRRFDRGVWGAPAQAFAEMSFVNTRDGSGVPIANGPDLSSLEVGGRVAVKVAGTFHSGSTTTPAASDWWEVIEARVTDSKGNTSLRVRTPAGVTRSMLWPSLTWTLQPGGEQLAAGHGVQLHPERVPVDTRVLPATNPVQEYHGETKATLLTSIFGDPAVVPFFRRHLLVTLEQLNLASFGTALPSFEVITE